VREDAVDRGAYRWERSLGEQRRGQGKEPNQALE
jgi:hypothetical protein